MSTGDMGIEQKPSAFQIWKSDEDKLPLQNEKIMSEGKVNEAVNGAIAIDVGNPALAEESKPSTPATATAALEMSRAGSNGLNGLDPTGKVRCATPPPESVSESVWKRMERVSNPGNPTAYVNVGPMAVAADAFPYPKWPVGHTSAAFESVAVKKSYILSPPEIYAECAHHGHEKAQYPWYKMLTLCVVAGCYVGFGFTLCLMVGGTLNQSPVGPPDERNLGLFRLIFGAVGFPFAFTTIVVCGAELYTSLCAYMMAALWEGTVDIWTCLRVWALSWCGNFAGCGLFVGLMLATGIFEGQEEFIKFLVFTKTHHTWGQTLVRGIIANWLVGIATWMANAAQDLTGKAVGIWLPISCFAMIGFEHCIANQFVIPMAIALGAPINAKEFVWNNLIPATLGNWIGGAICLGSVYAVAFGRPHVWADEWWERVYVSKRKKAA